MASDCPKRGRRRLGGLANASEGNALIEFALVMPIVMLAIVGVADYGMQMYVVNSLEGAARAGMQVLAKNPGDTAAVESAVLGASTLSSAALSVSVGQMCQCADGSSADCSGTCADGGDVEVSYTIDASTVHTNLFPYPGIPDSVTLTGRAQIRVR